MQRFPHARVPVAGDVASAAGSRAKNGLVIRDGASGFGSAAIDAEVDGHAVVLTQERCWLLAPWLLASEKRLPEASGQWLVASRQRNLPKKTPHHRVTETQRKPLHGAFLVNADCGDTFFSSPIALLRSTAFLGALRGLSSRPFRLKAFFGSSRSGTPALKPPSSQSHREIGNWVIW
jgi:hypothetical protein